MVPCQGVFLREVQSMLGQTGCSFARANPLASPLRRKAVVRVKRPFFAVGSRAAFFSAWHADRIHSRIRGAKSSTSNEKKECKDIHLYSFKKNSKKGRWNRINPAFPILNNGNFNATQS